MPFKQVKKRDPIEVDLNNIDEVVDKLTPYYGTNARLIADQGKKFIAYERPETPEEKAKRVNKKNKSKTKNQLSGMKESKDLTSEEH